MSRVEKKVPLRSQPPWVTYVYITAVFLFLLLLSTDMGQLGVREAHWTPLESVGVVSTQSVSGENRIISSIRFEGIELERTGYGTIETNVLLANPDVRQKTIVVIVDPNMVDKPHGRAIRITPTFWSRLLPKDYLGAHYYAREATIWVATDEEKKRMDELLGLS